MKRSKSVKQVQASDTSATQTPVSVEERIALLGIAPKELTETVSLALSALYEKLDDVTYELSCARRDFAELEQLVDVDCIAPVPNRRAFMRRLSWAMAMFERYDHPCSILYFDLNGFKQLNDAHGHAAGDMAIRHVCGILADALRQSDFMARLGGDEFAIIMYFSKQHDAELRGAKIADRMRRGRFEYEGKSLSVSASFGVYEIEKGVDAETALSLADKAMYQDKKRYRERFVHDAT
jgi:diguanylate cyclase (GGDEF)-like protein